MWHVSSRSGVATLRTAIHLLLTYFYFTYFYTNTANRARYHQRVEADIHSPVYKAERQAVAWCDQADREQPQTRRTCHSRRHRVAAGSLHRHHTLSLSTRRLRSQTDGLVAACSCWMPASWVCLEVTSCVPPAPADKQAVGLSQSNSGWVATETQAS